MMEIIKDPLELEWLVLREFGNETPSADVFVIAKDNERWWIILKNIPPRLAEHIVAVHNARYNY